MKIIRIANNPIITSKMMGLKDGENINGPSVIEIPDWMPNRMGRFYLYFAHHRGDYIRLAYSDKIEGPWTIYKQGSLRLSQQAVCIDHMASPDVHVDENNKKIWMLFHGVSRLNGQQLTFVAESFNGIDFAVQSQAIGNFYLRVVPYKGQWIGMSKGGKLYLSKSGLTELQSLNISAFQMSSRQANLAGDVRHVALKIIQDKLIIFYTKIGDSPEGILKAEIDLSSNYKNWKAENHEYVLKPEFEYEGVDFPIQKSKPGAATSRENALRDPAVLESDGENYLFYSVAGESGIAVAKIEQINNTEENKPIKIHLQNENGMHINFPPVMAVHKNSLSQAINFIDLNHPSKKLNRVYVMGCGRSGTWLLLALLSSLEDVCIIPKELGVEYFGVFSTKCSTLIIKRSFDAFLKVRGIPKDIEITYIIRHPFDVLTSQNLTNWTSPTFVDVS